MASVPAGRAMDGRRRRRRRAGENREGPTPVAGVNLQKKNQNVKKKYHDA